MGATLKSIEEKGVTDFMLDEEEHKEALGDYTLEWETDGSPVYRHHSHFSFTYLHHTSARWEFTKDFNDVYGFLSNENEDECPSGSKTEAWKYFWYGHWFEDETVMLECSDNVPTTQIKTAQDLALAQKAAGDSVMSRLWEHVKDDGGRVDEQIDRNTGVQASAEGLTWSYANIPHSLHVREQLMTSLKELA